MANDGEGRRARMSYLKDNTLLTKEELAARWKVTTKTIETWVKDGCCPKPVKLGKRRIRFRLTDIEQHEAAN